MRDEVTVVLASGREFVFELGRNEAPLDALAARRWLDQEFVALDCAPLRASGKVLTVDKLLVLAQTAGPALLADAEWGPRYAQAASAALGRGRVRVDVAALKVS